jgi:hypothetical protein
MGSLIYLRLGRLELDWGKNSFFNNHSALFAPDDVRLAPYYYTDDVVEEKPAFVRRLGTIIRRLDMLGFTLQACESLYDQMIQDTPRFYPSAVLTFQQFASILQQVNVEAVRLPEGESGDYDLGEYVSELFHDPEFAKANPSLPALTREDGAFFENLNPYLILRVLAQNPVNADKEVVWSFADVLEGGWAEESDIYEGVPQRERWLVVTEGSSDGHVLREALPIVARDVSDFFEFVDMSENYPFTGTGNVFRFCQGLARIRIQNRVLVVLDNDTAGHSAARRIASLNLPPNMRVAVLPDLEECSAVKTLGPSGEQRENINGRAVSIEWFLDTTITGEEPTVRWTSYDSELNRYQGELIGKDAYVRDFLTAATRRDDRTWPKLGLLWSHLLAVCRGEGS